jgi:antitoxin component of RelBE/YafQ-DinJ toxin-antitoxin module
MLNQYFIMTNATRSFRVEKDVSNILDEEAERMGISVNALVNIILKHYSEFNRFLSKIDLVILNRDILTKLLEFMDEQNLFKMGLELGETIPKDTILFWKKDLDQENVFEYLEKILCRYGLLGTYDQIDQQGEKIIVIRHRLGKKGSIFFHGYIKSTLNIVGLDSNIEVTESSVKAKIAI